MLYTHHHIDHLAGLDDLRRFNWIQNALLPCHGQPETLERLRTMFAYAFEDDPEYPSSKPQLVLHKIDGPSKSAARRSRRSPCCTVRCRCWDSGWGDSPIAPT